jgi:carboxyl-terminal processing protease
VDLRFNGGGALSEAIEVSGLFIDRGPVVQVKDEKGNVKAHDDETPGVSYSGPMVLVTNRLSASASEIFAGAIKDYGRGIVVGDTSTHGKGTVQNVLPVGPQLFRFLDQEDRGALKLTIQQFYRVNGDSTQNRGVESDIVLPSGLDHRDVGESFLDDAMAFDQVEPSKHQIDGMVSPEMIASLKQSSRARVAQDADFQKLQKQIDQYLERKNRKTVSLNEAVLKKEREEEGKSEEEDPLQDDPEKKEDVKRKDKPLFPDNFYNKELVRITADYIALLKKGTITVKK